MGRQQYITRLALGRSPYEAPETPALSPAESHHARNRDADGYVQQYDDRGHPVFPASKALARDLRRAKNDVLSTMGVVVSGEAGRSSTLKDKKAFNIITSENDYGLAIVALDHAIYFFGSWWIESLRRRVQTFRSYTHNSLIRLHKSEVQRFGWPAELFAGMPLWAARIALPIFRTQLFEPALQVAQGRLMSYLGTSFDALIDGCFSILRSSARLVSFVCFEQIHMFCILQTLHLIPYNVFPRPFSLLPFTRYSLIQRPPLPNDMTLQSLGDFAFRVATSPFAFAFIYVFVRPVIEEKLYRLIRRHLPKQEHPDEVSVQVALENDLLEWTIPTMGRRTEEEIRRSSLSLFDDIKEEWTQFQKWLWTKLSRKDHSGALGKNQSGHVTHDDLVSVGRTLHADSSVADYHHESALLDRIAHETDANVSTSAVHGQNLTQGQFTHSPGEMTPTSLNEAHLAERAERDQQSESSWRQLQNYDQDSRSNTSFSRPQTPESPLASPRIRASLTHQNSFTTTMELSLQTSRSTQETLEPVVEIERSDTVLIDGTNILGENRLDLNGLILDQVNQEIGDGHGENINTAIESWEQQASLNPTGDADHSEVLGMDVARRNTNPVLPHVVEEPMHSPMHQADLDVLSEVGTEATAPRVSTDMPNWRSSEKSHIVPNKQRVTVLSSYPADAIAHHLAATISDFIFIPFESFFYRSLANAYMSSQLALLYRGPNFVSRSDLRGLNAFAGGGSRGDMVAYMWKLLMIQGIQLGISGAIVGIFSSTAIEAGKRVFNWGRL